MKLFSASFDLSSVAQQQLFVIHFSDKESSSIAALKASSSVVAQLLGSDVISTKLGNVTPLIGHSDLPAQRISFIGAGNSADFNETAFFKVVASLAGELKSSTATSAALTLDDLKPAQRSIEWTAAKASEALLAALYKYDTTKSKKNEPISVTEVALLSSQGDLDSAISTGQAMAKGVNVARELGNLPANICDPDYLAQQARELGQNYSHIDVEILEEEQLLEMGMGAFMAVSQGSDKAGKIIVMKYNGASADEKPHVLVGKGLTFDSGGISIKPAAGMEEMKWDMLGAASVFGAMNTIAELKPKLNIIGVVATAENMVSGGATRPGDVVTCMNGKTVEIINTDAEGRLVLCDTLTYVERFEPASVIDIATLTGAIVVGLGHHATAVYANKDELQAQIVTAGQETWDRGWAMPMWQDYREQLDSPYADLRNVGSRAGGSITAALYLSEFAENYPWAHLDIAGTGWENAKAGATGRPVGMLVQYLLNQQS